MTFGGNGNRSPYSKPVGSKSPDIRERPVFVQIQLDLVDFVQKLCLMFSLLVMVGRLVGVGDAAVDGCHSCGVGV